MTKKKQVFGLFFLILLGAFLRGRGLGACEFWYDEAYTGLTIEGNWGEMFSLIAQDVYPPLYYVLAKIWASLFGTTEFALRSLSALFGTLTIPAAYFLVENLFDKNKNWVPLATAFFVAVNPFLIAYSQEARSYSLLAFLLLLAGNFFYQGLVKSGQKFNRDWFLFSFFISLAFLTHYLAVFSLISFFVFGLFAARLSLPYAKILILPATTFLAWLPVLRQQGLDASELGWVPKFQPAFFFRSIAAFFFGVKTKVLGIPPVNQMIESWQPKLTGLILFLLFFGGSLFVFKRIKEREKEFLTFLLYLGALPIILAALLSFFGINLYLERYLIGGAIFLLIYFVLIFVRLVSNWTVFLVGFSYLVFVLNLPVCCNNLGYRRFAAELKSVKGRIIFVDPFEFVVARFYWGRGFAEQVRIYDLSKANVYQNWRLISDEQVLWPAADTSKQDVLVATSLPRTIHGKDGKRVGEFFVYQDWEFQQ